MRKAASRSVQILNPNDPSSFSKFFSSISFRNHAYNEVQVLPQSLHGQFMQQQRLLLLLQACKKAPTLKETKPLHALTVTMASNSTQPIFLYNNLISLYVLQGELSTAREVFGEMTQRNVVSYNTIIGGYSRNGSVEEAWNLFSEMRRYGFEPTQHTFAGLLSCASLKLSQGFQLQAQMVKSGLFHADPYAGTALLSLFGRNGCIDEVVCAFEEMPLKNLVTWNTVISLFGNYGFSEESMFLFRELVRTGAGLSECSFMGVLSGFASEQDLELGEQVHDLLIKNGFDSEVSVLNSLINMYVKCSCIRLAEKMFELGCVRDVVSWNTMIGALAKSERPSKVLELFLKMSVDGVLPNETTFVSVINSCTNLQILVFGEYIHAKVIRNKIESNVFVGSALVDFYAKCDNLESAHCCFDEIDEKNVVCWNALILGYSNKCFSSVSLLKRMLQLGYRPNESSFSAALKSSLVFELQQLHCLIMRMGYQQNEYVSSALITSYAKNGIISDALIFDAASNKPLLVGPSNAIAGVYNKIGQYHKTQDLFSLLEEPDIVSWNILIAACARNGDYKEVFELFKHMQMAQIYPDNYTVVSLLSVCAKLCNLALGSSIHGFIIKTDFKFCDTFVFNVLIDMYGKCGCIESSLKIFNKIIDRNIITWTALISALGVNGYANEALKLFREMESLGFKPDGVALVAVFSACRHGGLVKEGMELFWQMKKSYGIEPNIDHYHCVVDLLARCGHLQEAEQVISNMPFPPNALIWRSFLEGCKRWKTAENQESVDVNLKSEQQFHIAL